jgi:hypothetical protein
MQCIDAAGVSMPVQNDLNPFKRLFLHIFSDPDLHLGSNLDLNPDLKHLFWFRIRIRNTAMGVKMRC